MTDIAITVARPNWASFLAEHGPGTTLGRQHIFQHYGERPPAAPGDRLYVVSHGRLRAALMIDLIVPKAGGWQIVASMIRPVTLEGYVPGFPEIRRRWWDTQHEAPFDAWRTDGVSLPPVEPVADFAHGKTASTHAGSSA